MSRYHARCPECHCPWPGHAFGCPETPEVPEEINEPDPDDVRDARIDRENDQAAAANYGEPK
jgi:hypothetical protein